MEEILASIRRIIEDGDVDARGGGEAEQEPTPAAANIDSPERTRAELETGSADIAQQRATPLPAEDHADVEDNEAEEVKTTPFRPVESMSARRDDAQMEGEQPLLSEQAGRRVADAFAQLGEAFEASRRRNFDLAAEEMLRSMMREWLDDNMPALVERLVREEIERLTRD